MPSDSEWNVLISYLGGLSTAGGKLKESGTTHWVSPNTGATNESGFTALPGGIRTVDGHFNYNFLIDEYWSSTAYQSNISWSWDVDMDNLRTGISLWYDITANGYSVRCISDS